MPRKLNILVAASEATPFAKEGGLADVVSALSKQMKRMGHDVRIVLPRYYGVDKDRWDLKPVGGTLKVPMGVIGTLWAGIVEGRLPGTDVPVYFIEYDRFFGRAGGLYTGSDGQGYMDNDNRFVFLSRGALELCRALDFKPDVIHVHDWQTAAIPVFLNTLYKDDPLLGGAASLLTIHNIQSQGDFYEGVMDVLGVGWEHFNYLELEAYSRANILKGGIYHSTLLTTVSPTYAREIQTPELGYALDGVVRDRAGDLFGIMNGVDYDDWSPERDRLIAANYSASDLKGKAVCKAALQKRLGLPVRPDVPVFGMVSRLVHQKGIDVLAGAIERLVGLDIQIAVLGSGETWAQLYFGDLPRRHPHRIGCYIGFDNSLAHAIEAGSDFFLMPSRFEPCGLNQLYSLRYGTPPVVRATGGLNDTVENFDEASGKGTGFKFYDLTSDALFDTVGWATHTFYNRPDDMLALRRRGMELRFSWEKSAKEYEKLYHLAVERRTGHPVP
jgi:starch synthase